MSNTKIHIEMHALAPKKKKKSSKEQIADDCWYDSTGFVW